MDRGSYQQYVLKMEIATRNNYNSSILILHLQNPTSNPPCPPHNTPSLASHTELELPKADLIHHRVLILFWQLPSAWNTAGTHVCIDYHD
jgi:hypothetical protein